MTTTAISAGLSSAARSGPRLFIAWFTLAMLGQLASRAQAQSTPTHQFLPPPRTFIAEAFALSSDGAQLAYVTAVGTKDVVLHIVDLGLPEQHLQIAALPGRVQSLFWLGPGRLLAVTRSGPGGRLMARVFTGAGPEGPNIGPADHIALGALDGKPVVTAYTRASGKAGVHRLAAFDALALQPLVSRKIVMDGQRRIEVNGQRVRLLWWGEDFTSAAVRHPGKYDKARDLRLPDRFARVDLLSNTLVDDAAIEPAGFARLASFQRLHPGKTLFVHVDPRDRKLLLIDSTRSRDLVPVQPLEQYDPTSIRWQKVGDDEVLVSLTVDPLNVHAVARRQRDRQEIELCSVNRTTGAMSLRLTLDGENRDSAWHVGGGRLVLLRKHRGFSRGGVVLQVYSLPVASARR